MHPHMDGKRTFIVESTIADIALKLIPTTTFARRIHGNIFLTWKMHAYHMFLVTFRIAKYFFTQSTRNDVRFLQFFVILQLAFLVKRFVTPTTLERISRYVDRFFVGANSAFVIEPFITIRTFERFFASVQSHMYRQSLLVVQNFVAAVTLDSFFDSFMRPGVGYQIRLMVKTFHADFALVRFFTGVKAHMYV